MNAFIGKRYSLKIQENCSRIEERLRIHCTIVAKQLVGKHGGSRQRLLPKIKSVAVRHSELSTVASVDQLLVQVSQLQSVNVSIKNENRVLNIKCQEASAQVHQAQKVIEKATVDIEKLKTENNNLFKIIEKYRSKKDLRTKENLFRSRKTPARAEASNFGNKSRASSLVQ